MNSFIMIFLVASAFAIGLNVILKKFNIPTIISYILTGTIISYIFNLHSDEELSHIAEFGIVFLMFTIGLEFSLKHLISMKKEVFFNGGLQMALSGSIYYFIAQYLFNIEEKSAIIIGFTLALSSTAIVLKTLNDNGDIHTLYGRKSLGILLFQDIAVIPLLLMINIFTNSESSLENLLIEIFTSAFIILVLLYVVGKYFLNKLLFWIVRTDSSETFIATILFLVIASSYLAHVLGFSYSLGAFLAGMMIAETKYKYQIEANLIPFRDLLLGLFFLTVGIQINFLTIMNYWYIILSLVVIIMAIKAGVIFIILRSYLNTRVSFKSAMALSQVGEFALAIFELARSNSLLDEKYVNILVLVVILSMILTPFILNNIIKITDTVISESSINDDFKIKSSGVENHIIVCGYGKLGQEIAKRLKVLDEKYLIVENDIYLASLAKLKHEPIFFGNAAQKNILKNLNITTCKAIIVAIDNEKNLRLICENIDSFNKPIDTIVKISDDEEQKLLEDFHVKHILNENEEIAKSLIDEALSCKT